MIISIPFSSYILLSWNFFTGHVAKIIILGFITYHLLDSYKRLSIFAFTWIAINVFAVITALLNFSISTSYLRYGAGGLAGSSYLGDANDFALAMNIALPFVFYFMLNSKNKIAKILLCLSGIFLIAGIIITNSRGGFITLILTSSFILFQSQKKILGLVLGIFLVTGILFLAPTSYVERIRTITGAALEEGDTGYGRITLWKAGLKMMIDNPFTGVGLIRSQAAYGYDYHREGDTKWRVLHNSYISIGAETGVIGFIAYIYLLYVLFKENFDIRKKLETAKMEKHFLYSLSCSIAAGLFAYCVGSMFLTVWYYIHIYLIIALTLAIKRLMVEEYLFEIQDNKEKNLVRGHMGTN